MQFILIHHKEKVVQEKQVLRNLAVNLQSATTQLLKDHNTKIIQTIEFMKHRPALLLKSAEKILIEKKKFLRKQLVSDLIKIKRV